MRKFYIVLLALFMVFAFSAAVAGSASAETTLLAEWLFNGAAITALLPVETTGELKVTTLVLGLEAVAVRCSGVFDGSFGPNGEDEITKLLNTSKEEIGSELVGLSLDCTVVTGASGSKCSSNELAELWTDNLPWHTNLFLMESGTILDSLLRNIGYHLFCPVGGGENLCTGPSSITMTNEATDVKGTFDATSEEFACTTGTNMITGEFLTTDTEAGTLQVSSE